MKHALLTFTVLLATTGCGVLKQQMCGPLDMAAGCNAFFGPDTDAIEDINTRLDSLETEVARQFITLDFLLASHADSGATLVSIQTDILLLYAEIAFNLQAISEIEPLVINNTNITIINDIRVIDPCPSVSSSSPKEYILKLGDVYVSYFESGNGNNARRFLSVLVPNVSYQTTDSRACSFSVGE